MNRVLILVVGAGALALPTAQLAAASASRSRQVVSTKTTKFVGAAADADQWGTVQISVTVKTTTSGKKVTRKFVDLGGSYSYHTSRSQYIMTEALPLLRQEFLTAQTANVHMISGATATSDAFVQSLQSALLKARA